MYNKRVLSTAVSELGKAKKPAKKRDNVITAKRQQTPIVTTEGFKQGPPPLGSKYRIPGDTLYNPTPYPIEAVSDNGIRKTLNPFDTSNIKFPGANYVDEYQKQKYQKQKGGQKDSWGRSSLDPWYGFDSKTKKFTVKDQWGRKPGDEWYGFNPNAKQWTKGSKAKPLKFETPQILSAEKKYHDGPLIGIGQNINGGDGMMENLFEVVDPSGITSWDDIARSYEKEGMSPNTWLEIAGAIPLVGKAAKASAAGIHLAKYKGLDKLLYKTLPQSNAVSRTLKGAAYAGRGYDGYQAYDEANRPYALNNMGPKYEEGGEYYDDELTQEEIDDLIAQGYIVEDLPRAEVGGSLLTKKVTCQNCGWEWDAADGGSDLTTCHKCGGKGLVHAQFGFGMGKLRKRKVDKQNEQTTAATTPFPTNQEEPAWLGKEGAPYAFVGEHAPCGEGEVWDETSKSCVKKDIQELPTMYASANPETNKKRVKFIDKANALWDTVEGRKVWMENGPKNYSLNELSKFVHNVKDYKDQATIYEKYRRMAQDNEISGDEFGRLYRENNWARFDQNTGRENFKGEWKKAVEKGNQEKAEYAKRMGTDIANTLGEYSGVNSVIRTVTNPIDTLSGAGQTIVDIGMTAPEVPYMAYDYLSNLFTPWNREYGNEYSGSEDINPATGQPYWSGSQGAIDLVTSFPFFKGAAAVGNTGFKAGVNAVNKVPSSKVFLQSAEQRLGNPTAYNLLQGTETGLRGKIANKYYANVQKNIEKEANKILKKSVKARRNGDIELADNIYQNEYIPKLKQELDIRARLLDWRRQYSGLPIENTGMGGGEGRIYSLTGDPNQVVKVGHSFNTEDELGKLIEVGQNFQMPGSQFAFPTRYVPLGGKQFAQFMPKLNYQGYLPVGKTTDDLAAVAESLNQQGVGIDYAGVGNYGRVGDDMGFVDLTYIGKPGQRTSAYDWSMFHPDKSGYGFKLQENLGSTAQGIADDAAGLMNRVQSQGLTSQGLVDDALKVNPADNTAATSTTSAAGTAQSTSRPDLVDFFRENTALEDAINAEANEYYRLAISPENMERAAAMDFAEGTNYVDALQGLAKQANSKNTWDRLPFNIKIEPNPGDGSGGYSTYSEIGKQKIRDGIEPGIEDRIIVIYEDAPIEDVRRRIQHELKHHYTLGESRNFYSFNYGQNLSSNIDDLGEISKTNPQFAHDMNQPAFKESAVTQYDYLRKPAEIDAYIQTNLRDDLVKKGILKNHWDVLDDEKMARYLMQGNLRPEIRQYLDMVGPGFLDMFNKGVFGLTGVGTAGYMMNQGTTEEPTEGLKKGGKVSKKYSRSLEAKNELYTENRLVKKRKPKNKKIFSPTSPYFQTGGENQVECDDDGRCYETDQIQENLDAKDRVVKNALKIDQAVLDAVLQGYPANDMFQEYGVNTTEQITGDRNSFACANSATRGYAACDPNVKDEHTLSNDRMKAAVASGKTPFRKVGTYSGTKYKDVLKPGQLISFMGPGFKHMVKYAGPNKYLQSSGHISDWGNYGVNWISSDYPSANATVYEYDPFYAENERLEEIARTNPTYVPGTASVGRLPIRPAVSLATQQSERVLPAATQDLGVREFGGIPNLPLNKNRKVLRDWTYGQSIGMLQEADGGIPYAQAGLNLQGIRTAPVKTTPPKKKEPVKEAPVRTVPTPAATQMNLQGIRTAPVVTRQEPKKEVPKKQPVKPRPVTPQIAPLAMMDQVFDRFQQTPDTKKPSGFDMMREIHEMYNTKIASAKDLRPKSKEEQRRETSPLEVFTGTSDLFKSYTTADQKEQTESPLDMFGHVNDAFNEAANKRFDRVPNQQGSPLDMFGQVNKAFSRLSADRGPVDETSPLDMFGDVNDAFRTFNADHKVVDGPSTLDMFGDISKAFDEAADKNIKLEPYDVKDLFKQGLVGQMDQKGLFTKSDDKQKLEDAINRIKDNQGLGSYIDAVGNVMHDLGFDYGQYALNGIKRKLTKWGWVEEQEQQTSSNLEIPPSVEEYYKNPGMLKEEFMVPGSSRKYHQQSMPLSNIKLGFRNRGDYRNINTEGLELTTFHPFTKTLNNSDNKSVFAIDPQGNLHTGKYKDLKNNKGWRFSATFMNKIVNIEDTYLDGARSGNAGYMQPKIKTIDDNGNIKYGAMNILTKGKGKDDYYGSIQGGRVLFVNPKTKEQFLVSGSLAHIKSEFKRLKGDNKYLEAWTLDNGTYSRGLSYKDKKLTPDRLKKYDNENGSGGNGLYIMTYKAPVNKFKEEYVKDMPNIRSKTDQSYKKGHALKNEVKKIVLHHTAYEDEKLNDQQVRAQYMKKGSSSSHVVIEENGKRTIYASPEQVTFHAGKSKWEDREDVNDFSVGVEFQGNTNNKPLTDAQVQSFVEYYSPIAERYNLSLKDIITHQMIAPGRKPDITDADYKRILNYMKQQGFK